MTSPSSSYSDGDFELDGYSPSNKHSTKDTSQGFMELLNVGNIDGSFEGSFLYFAKITQTLHRVFRPKNATNCWL